LGNHEFTCGLEGLSSLLREVSSRNLPLLCTNLSLKEEVREDPFWRNVYRSLKKHVFSYLLYDVNGVRIGLLGLMGEKVFIPEAWPADFVIDFANLAHYVDLLKAQGAKLIIILFHGSLEEAKNLCKKVEGVDIVLCGHSHLVTVERCQEKLLMEAGSEGKQIGVIEVECSKDSEKGYSLKADVIDIPYRNINFCFSAEKELLRHFTNLKKRNLSEELLYLPGSSFLERAYLVADAIRYVTEVNVGITTPGERGYFPSERIVVADVFKIGRTGIPHDGIKGDVLCKYYLTLLELKFIFEATVCMYRELGLDVLLVPSGVKIIIDSNRPPLERIIQLSVNGKVVYQQGQWKDDERQLLSISTSLLLVYGLREVSSNLLKMGVIEQEIFPRDEKGRAVEWRNLEDLKPLICQDETEKYLTLWKAVLKYLLEKKPLKVSEKERLKDIGKNQL
jgi:hypothetical protein